MAVGWCGNVGETPPRLCFCIRGSRTFISLWLFVSFYSFAFVNGQTRLMLPDQAFHQQLKANGQGDATVSLNVTSHSTSSDKNSIVFHSTFRPENTTRSVHISEFRSNTSQPDVLSQEASLTVTDIEKSPTGSVAITAEPEPALLSLADQLSTVSAGLDTTDLFPEFLPVDNRSSEALVISYSSGLEDDLTVGSGDGEILDMTGSTSDDLHGLRPLLLSTGSPSLLHHSSTLSPDREGRVVENHTSILTTSATSGTTYHTGNANISQRTTVSVYALHSTTTSPKYHHVHGHSTVLPANSPTRSPIGLYHYREPKLVRPENDYIPASSDVDTMTEKPAFTLSPLSFTTVFPFHYTSTRKPSSTRPSSTVQSKTRSPTTDLPFIDTTPWSFAMLPEGRNLDSDAIGLALNNGSEYDTSRKWTAFTIPHTQLPAFLLSTIPSLISTGTIAPPVHETTERSTTWHYNHSNRTKVRPTFRHVSLTTTAIPALTDEVNVALFETPGLSVVGTSTDGHLFMEVDITLDTTTRTPATEMTSMMTSPPTEMSTETSLIKTSRGPSPLLYWSEKAVAEEPALFTDDMTGQPSETQQSMLQESTLNISREILDNIVTVIMKCAATQQDCQFDNSNKKILAQLVFWPLIHNVTSSSTVSTESPSSTPLSAEGLSATDPSANFFATSISTSRLSRSVLTVPALPILHFLAKTPKLIDGLWIITAYATYNRTEKTMMNGSTLLALFHEAQLKLMTKMNLQVVSLFVGLPTMPLNLTGRDGFRSDGIPPTYNPLFERFSNLFIPLIVLATVCAFVAIITVVCLVKRSNTFTREQVEYQQKEKFLRPWEIAGVDNPIADHVMMESEKTSTLRPSSSKVTASVATGSVTKEMRQTENWVVPMDLSTRPLPSIRRDEEDTKL